MADDSSMPPLNEARLEAFLKDWKFTRKQLERHIQDLQDQFVSGVLKINVPVFGLSSDVNDLGILSGIAIVALLGLLRFAIWREEQNVMELFKLARTCSELRRVLHLFSMTQVFTIPPWTRDIRAQRVTRLIYWMPAPAYGLVAVYDTWQTYNAGKIYRQPMDWLTLIIEFSVLLVILYMRYQIGLIADRIGQQWIVASGDVEKETLNEMEQDTSPATAPAPVPAPAVETISTSLTVPPIAINSENPASFVAASVIVPTIGAQAPGTILAVPTFATTPASTMDGSVVETT